MRRFLRDNDLRTMAFPDEHQQFQSLLSAAATQRGTLGEMLSEDECDKIAPLPPVKRIALDEDDTSNLKICIKLCFQNIR